MEFIPNLGNVMVILSVCLCMFIEKSTQKPRELSLGDPKLCSDITKRKIRYESFIVTQGRVSHHPVSWLTPDICKFEAQSAYRKGGVVAVIQKLQLRRNSSSNECIDYIQFQTGKKLTSPRYCGVLEARDIMNYDEDFEYPQYFPISYGNSFIDVDGGLDVIIYISKQPLKFDEKTEFEIVFTSYQNCSKHDYEKYNNFQECEEYYTFKICINRSYFGDGYINCPHFGCPDEGGCLPPLIHEGKSSIGDKVIIGSISTLGILFAIFIVIIWAFKKHKLFCWAEDFANPTATPENNRNSRVIEMNEQTGARLAEGQSANVTPSAPPPAGDKDLPPSYESLFPESNPS